MKRRISTFLLELLLDEASHDEQREICGLLVGKGDLISDFRPLPNAAEDPSAGFRFHPESLFAAMREARARGEEIVGCYHSHPSGLAQPSAADAAEAAGGGELWMILAGNGATLWQARAGGRWLKAFDPVELECVNRAGLQPAAAAANRTGA